MDEIIEGIFAYVVRHEDIDHDVNSTFVASLDQPFLIDPMKPDVDASWFEGREPKHVFMTNRLHDRGIPWFVETFGCTVWCHESGLHELEEMDLEVTGFRHGDMLPCGVEALEVGVLCPEETAFLVPAASGVPATRLCDTANSGLFPTSTSGMILKRLSEDWLRFSDLIWTGSSTRS